jgi:hypothetical protein
MQCIFVVFRDRNSVKHPVSDVGQDIQQQQQQQQQQRISFFFLSLITSAVCHQKIKTLQTVIHPYCV